MSGSKRKKKRQNGNSRRSHPAIPRSAASKRSPSAHTESGPSWKVVVTASLTVLAIIADLTGVFTGPSILDLIVSALALVAGSVMILARRRVRWISAPGLSGTALIIVGALVGIVALRNYLSGRETALHLPMQATRDSQMPHYRTALTT
jgi:hypothetical protein